MINYWLNLTEHGVHIPISHKTVEDNGEGSQISLILSLSLFIILLAFFIVLNGLSEFSEPKVNQAFDSLDIAFAQNIFPTEYTKKAVSESQSPDGGAGDAVEELQGILKSILPNLNLETNPDATGGQTMMVRMSKDRFEALAADLIPLLVRVLMQKDQKQNYHLVLTSFVRDPLAQSAGRSFAVIDDYYARLIYAGLDAHRLQLRIETGNPALLGLSFYPMEGDDGS